MSRLPIPGQDKGIWGDVLNDFLGQSHNSDGTLKNGVVSAATLDASSQASLAKAGTSVQIGGDLSGNPSTPAVSKLQGTAVSSSAPTSGQVLQFTNGSWAPGTVTQTVVSDANGTTKGIVQLTGDLGGTASSPTVPGLSTKLDTTAAASTYAPKANPTFTGTVTVPTPVNNTDAATKTYVDTTVASGTPDANATTKGKVQLAGDLSGSAAAPTVAKLGGITLPGTAPTNGQVLTATSGIATSWSTPASAPVTSVAGRTGAVVIAEADVTNLTTDLAAKATDTAVVHLAGTETVTGAKTFSGNVTLSGTTTVAAPVNGTDATTKTYVDNAVSTGTSGAAPAIANQAPRNTTGTLTANSLNPVDVSGGTFTVTLPSAPADKSRVIVKKIDASANIVTIATGGSDVLNKTGGGTSLTLQVPNQAITFQYATSGAIWYVINDDVPAAAISIGVTRTVTSAYTLVLSDHVVLVDPTSAAFTVTLPTAVGYYGRYTISNVSASGVTNQVTVGTTSSQTISGANTVTVGTQGSGAAYSSLDVVSNGANWLIV